MRSGTIHFKDSCLFMPPTPRNKTFRYKIHFKKRLYFPNFKNFLLFIWLIVTTLQKQLHYSYILSCYLSAVSFSVLHLISLMLDIFFFCLCYSCLAFIEQDHHAFLHLQMNLRTLNETKCQGKLTQLKENNYVDRIKIKF